MSDNIQERKNNYILVVEDSPTQAEMLRYLLQQNNHSAKVANSGEDALLLIKNETPALILTDIVMPGMSGYELCKKVKSGYFNEEIPVLLVTALSDPKDLIKGLESGADNFIVKPYDEVDLVRTVNDLLLDFSLQKNDEAEGAAIIIENEQYIVSADPRKVIRFLLSTYGAAEKKRKELEEEVINRRAVEEALRQANKKLSLLGSITRHDVLNKVIILNGFLPFIKRKITDETVLEDFGRIEQAGIAIKRLIDFTKEYENLGSESARWHDVDAIINGSLIQQFTNRIELKTELKGLSLFADGMLEKVFYNLVENAVRHGGNISYVKIYFMLDGIYLKIICEDNGRGIADEEKESVFERGYGKNTGLGLFLIREILSITEILIKENGDFGKGAHFEILVPPGKFRLTT